MDSDINVSKLIGGKRKNGHKSNCNCHICENMKNKAKRGGYKEEVEKEKEKMMGGTKKKNGHRKECTCPICKNMKNSKKRGSSKSRKTKKKRGGNDDKRDGYEEEKGETDEEKKNNIQDIDVEEEMEPYDDDLEEEKNGGKRKRGNGHKVNCKCPICKNMRKKKGGNPDLENKKGDIEEGGIMAISNNETTETTNSNEFPASSGDYDALDNAEKGEAGQNVVGGTRKKRRSSKKKTTRNRRR